ncbi:MAG: GNAT family N-acetyltransferase, partial [Anaerolineae bacterium]|nr:GNAT family N-acetyltransferase [Anaerolineae bacterium]
HPDLFQHAKAGYIADIFVDRAYRRQGIGAALVEDMLDWFADEDIRSVEWQTAAADANALEFWSAMDGLAIMVRMRMELNFEDDDDLADED